MKRLPTNSRRGTSDVDMWPRFAEARPDRTQDLFGGRNPAVSDPTPVRVRQMWAWFTEMDVQSISNGPAMDPARIKWEMSVHLRCGPVTRSPP